MQTGSTRRHEPIEALLAAPHRSVLAVIAGVEGPSYRTQGAMMAILSEKNRVGSLSSGCVEAETALHAVQAAQEGRPRTLRYGKGPPFLDLQLACGGGSEILLLPNPGRPVLARVVHSRAARIACSLEMDMRSGAMTTIAEGATARRRSKLIVRIEPEICFLIFGKGPEASTFAALVQSAGYPNLLLSPDAETLA